MDPYPSNSGRAAKADRPSEDRPKVERVTRTDATRRKPGLGKQFKATFMSGDAKGTLNHVLLNVLLPAAKDALVDAGSQGIERLVYGESTKRRPGYGNSALGHVAYNRMSQGARAVRDEPRMNQLSKRARSMHDFDEIVLPDRKDAEEVIDRMMDIASKYDVVSVADLYDLVGLESTHTDHKWGWEDLRGTNVRRQRSGGFLLDLPEAVYLA